MVSWEGQMKLASIEQGIRQRQIVTFTHQIYLMSYFENKVVWITGASSGIGEALAYTFAKAGGKLVLSARREEELKRVAANCQLSTDNYLILPLDVSRHEEAEAKAKEVLARFGQVDILVNNAGLSHWSKIKDLSMEVLKKIIDT